MKLIIKWKSGVIMKHIEKISLIVIALAVGSGLGYKLLTDFDPFKIIIFFMIIMVLGKVFYQIDKHI